MIRNIRLIIEYDGTAYHGWQSQSNAPCVQDVIEAAIVNLTGEKCRLAGSGRTDAGVHALGQVANFHTKSSIPAVKFSYALNSMLPEDIVIRSSDEAHVEFHSRFSAKSKKYRYLFYSSEQPSALLRNRAAHVPYRLDFSAMKTAAAHFCGTHDFSAFKSSGGKVASYIRTVIESRIEIPFYTDASPGPVSDQCSGCADKPSRPPSGVSPRHNNVSGDIIIAAYEIKADGFLYNMVRIIAGTLISAGRGGIMPEDIPSIIDGKDRRKAAKTAPPYGLYLVGVDY